MQRRRGSLDDLLRDHDFPTPSKLGVEQNAVMERNPRAPVLGSIALRAMPTSASSTNVRSMPSISNSRTVLFDQRVLRLDQAVICHHFEDGRHARNPSGSR
jgi:hypothetical protein